MVTSARTWRKLGGVATKVGEAGVMGMMGGELTMRGAKKAGRLTEGSGKMGTVSGVGLLLSGLG